jgi:hypothetical protein
LRRKGHCRGEITVSPKWDPSGGELMSGTGGLIGLSETSAKNIGDILAMVNVGATTTTLGLSPATIELTLVLFNVWSLSLGVFVLAREYGETQQYQKDAQRPSASSPFRGPFF